MIDEIIKDFFIKFNDITEYDADFYIFSQSFNANFQKIEKLLLFFSYHLIPFDKKKRFINNIYIII